MTKAVKWAGKETQFFANDGTVLNGGKLYQYQTGTTTNANTYTDVGIGTANSNPMTLDSAGRLQQDVFINQSMTFVLKDSSLVTIWTIDAVTAVDQLWTTVAKTSNYTTLVTDNYKQIAVDATAGGVTLTLLAAATAGSGYIQAANKIDASANTVTLDPNGSETIGTGATTQVLRERNEGILYVSDGTNWQIIAKYWGDNITLATGNITLTAGNLTITAGNATLADGTLSVNDQDARTNTVSRPLTIGADTTGTPAAGIGTGILINAESADESPSNFGALEFCATDVTAGSEDTYFDILTRVAGAALTKVWRFIATGAFKGIMTHANTADRTYTFPDTDISQHIIQCVQTQTGAVATGTTAVPIDDTIHQITEGDQYMTLAITPKSTANILYIDVVVHLTHSAAGTMAVSLFQDATANALATSFGQLVAVTQIVNLKFSHKMTAGTTSATTFKVRAGTATGATTTFNGSGGARFFGGVFASSITITEVSP